MHVARVMKKDPSILSATLSVPHQAIKIPTLPLTCACAASVSSLAASFLTYSTYANRSHGLNNKGRVAGFLRAASQDLSVPGKLAQAAALLDLFSLVEE